MDIDRTALGRALDGLLDAALEPQRWVELLERICLATGAKGAHILPLRGKFSPGVPATPSLAEGFEAYFKENWHQRDIRFGCLPVVLRKGVAIEHDIATEDDFARLPYYNDFLGRFGFRYSAMVGFKCGGDILSLGLQRSAKDGPFSRSDEKSLIAIQSRMTIATEFMRSVQSVRIASMSEAFNIANIACVFFDRSGKISLLNAEAERLLRGDVHIVRGEIATSSKEEAAALRSHLKSVLFSNDDPDGDLALPVRLSRRGKRPLLFRAQRLTGDVASLFSHSIGLAIITAIDDQAPPDTRLVRSMFGLTAAEARICALLARGNNLVEIAELSRLSYETVRTYSKAIYLKTETRRQSDLAALMAAVGRAASQRSGSNED